MIRLPATREDQITLARLVVDRAAAGASWIRMCAGADDPNTVVFTVSAPTWTLARELAAATAARLTAVGFVGVSWGAIPLPDDKYAYYLTINVTE